MKRYELIDRKLARLESLSRILKGLKPSQERYRLMAVIGNQTKALNRLLQDSSFFRAKMLFCLTKQG